MHSTNRLWFSASCGIICEKHANKDLCSPQWAKVNSVLKEILSTSAVLTGRKYEIGGLQGEFFWVQVGTVTEHDDA